MEFSPKEILDRFGIAMQDVVCIYPYGSRVYGSHTDESDHDWIIVYRSSMLPSGAFRDNAISSDYLKTHQAVCYSRSGFRNAVDTYDIVALECTFLPEGSPLMEDMKFPVRKWVPKEMASAIISKASASWHLARMHSDDDERTKKNVYHALRILRFGEQMAETGRIVDYSVANALKREIMEDEAFFRDKYLPMFNEASALVRKLSNA